MHWHISTMGHPCLPVLSLSLALLACDSLGGKPNPDAPEGIEDHVERSRVCSETRSAVTAWMREMADKLEDGFYSGKRGLMETSNEAEQIMGEVDEMRRQLARHCDSGPSASRDSWRGES